MKNLLLVTAASLLTSYSVAASALNQTDVNKTIVKLGTQNGVAYIALSPALSIGPAGTCLYDIVYVADLGTPAGKAYYATLLTAYSQGKPLSRIDYYNSGTNTICYMSLLEVQ